MNNYKIIIQYDGSRYNGWQKQGNTSNTIQGKIEEVLSRGLGEEIEIHGSGRTDAGVHAYGQVANFHTNFSHENEKRQLGCTLKEYLNTHLPKDIRILTVVKVDNRFHSRLHAISKKYIYKLDNGEVADPFTRKYAYHYPKRLDLELMNKAGALLLGEHDFLGFSANKRMKKSSVRVISSITIQKTGQRICIEIQGNGFLHHMVRIIVGTLLEVGEGKRTLEEVRKVLETKDRIFAGPTAPSTGLFLHHVEYEEPVCKET